VLCAQQLQPQLCVVHVSYQGNNSTAAQLTPKQKAAPSRI
jgi:hypothetical protein